MAGSALDVLHSVTLNNHKRTAALGVKLGRRTWTIFGGVSQCNKGRLETHGVCTERRWCVVERLVGSVATAHVLSLQLSEAEGGRGPPETPPRNQEAREVVGDSRVVFLERDALSHVFFSKAPSSPGMPWIQVEMFYLEKYQFGFSGVLENGF